MSFINTVEGYFVNVSIIGGGEEDTTNRIHKAMTSLMKLKQSWNSNYIFNENKTSSSSEYLSVKSVRTYGCETWKINKKDDAKLDTFLLNCHRRILKIRWLYLVPTLTFSRKLERREEN